MRPTLALLLLLTATVDPALAGSQMKQSPLMMHKAGASCAKGKYRGPQYGAGYGYRLGGCLPGGR